MTHRGNYLRCVEFRGPEWMPVGVGLMPATWAKYREDLEELVLRHPVIFGEYRKGSRDFDAFGPGYREEEYTDNWGCVWHNIAGGMEGLPLGNPLSDWDALDTYEPPDPLTKTERGDRPPWEEVAAHAESARERGELVWGHVERFFERLHFLRGFERFMMDLAEEPPQLPRLIRLVLDHNMMVVRKWMALKPDIMGFGDDLGTQTQVMMGPERFRKWLKPGYTEMFQACREGGAHVRLHSDGHLLEIIPDLIEAGVTILNPQVRANGLAGLAATCKGRICIDLDLDRQLFPFASEQQIRDHIHEAVDVLGSPDGGLMLYAECEPDVPLDNIETICDTLEALRGPLPVGP